MSLKRLTGCKPKSLRERFEASYIPEPNSGCWLWLGVPRNEYGHSRIKENGVQIPAHRAAWMLERGPIPEGAFICHKCDVASCVNPDHLYVGDHASNMRDKSARGRCALGNLKVRRGEEGPSAKLINEQVAAIRASAKPNRTLGAEYGVSQTAVWKIKHGRTWK